MSKKREIKTSAKNGNGRQSQGTTPQNDQKESNAYKSAMKAFEMTHKRLYPELYKE